jgi:hypothetical protein
MQALYMRRNHGARPVLEYRLRRRRGLGHERVWVVGGKQ